MAKKKKLEETEVTRSPKHTKAKSTEEAADATAASSHEEQPKQAEEIAPEQTDSSTESADATQKKHTRGKKTEHKTDLIAAVMQTSESHLQHATKAAEKAMKATQKATQTIVDAATDAGNVLAEAATETTDVARQALQDATQVTSDVLGEALEEATKTVRQVANEVVDTASHAAHKASENVVHAAQDVAKAAQKAAKQLQRSAEEILHEAQTALHEATHNHPTIPNDQSLVSSNINPDPNAPEVSIVIPVYNEEGIITSSVEDLVRRLTEMNWSYELILAENGSRDATTALANNLASRFPTVRVIHAGEPNYGKAMRLGILESRGTYVICDEIDLCDTRFYRDAMALLRSDAADMVVGSKLLSGSLDNRGWLRNTASQVLNNMLRVAVGFEGTDTHGLKAFRRDRILRLVEACQVDKDLFASELVIRVWRSTARIKEIPLQIEEKRKPSINLFRRVPNVLKNMGKLVWLFRVRGGM